MTERPPRRTPGRSPRRSARARLATPHDPLTGLLLTVPVFLVYHLGILGIRLRNGVDLVSSVAFELLDYSVVAYIAVTLALAAGLAVAVTVLRRRGQLRPAALVPVLLESVGWAVLMLFLVGWATERIFSFQVGGGAPLTPFAMVVMAAGAGFHEELVFRAGLFAGGAWLLHRTFGWARWRAALVAAVASALLFSAVHYLGPLGDPFSPVSFTFRVLAGLYLTAVFHYRGFAVAVYTHTFYDLIVFFLAPAPG
ncbi:MAG: type II CAAX prenyl endopeptidase Rce1 family protein [Sandaracinaceae bacterium]